MTPFLGPAFAPDGPLLVEALDGRNGVPRARHRRATRLVVDDFGNAVAHERRCADCRRWLPLDFTHYAPRTDGLALGMESRCGYCAGIGRDLRRRRDPERHRRLQRESYRRRSEDAAYREALRRRGQEAYARRFATDPERVRALHREAQRRRRARVKADAELARVQREKGRIDARLRRERAGVPLEAIRRLPVRDVVEDVGGLLPVAALVPHVKRYLEANAPENDGGGGRVEWRALRELGLDPRTWYDWREGKREVAQFDSLDAALVGLSLHPWDVWTGKPEHGGPDVARRALELFTGDAEAA